MGQASLRSSGSLYRWKQLKQSGISSFGIKNREPKYLCRVMKASMMMQIPMKLSSILGLLGSRVSSSKQKRQQTKGILVTTMVRTSLMAIPPRPPIQQEQLICTASNQKASQIQKTRFSEKNPTREKQITRQATKYKVFLRLLNSLNTTSSQFLSRNRVEATLRTAQTATHFRLVSILAKASLSRMQLAATTNAATWTIIHSDRLQTVFLGFKKKTARAKRMLQATTVQTRLLYSSVTGFRSAQKLNDPEAKLTKNLDLSSRPYETWRLSSIQAFTLNFPMIFCPRTSKQVTNSLCELDHNVRPSPPTGLLSSCEPIEISITTLELSANLPSMSFKQRVEACSSSQLPDSKNPSTSRMMADVYKKLKRLLDRFILSVCQLTIVVKEFSRKLLSSESFHLPRRERPASIVRVRRACWAEGAARAAIERRRVRKGARRWLIFGLECVIKVRSIDSLFQICEVDNNQQQLRKQFLRSMRPRSRGISYQSFDELLESFHKEPSPNLNPKTEDSPDFFDIQSFLQCQQLNNYPPEQDEYFLFQADQLRAEEQAELTKNHPHKFIQTHIGLISPSLLEILSLMRSEQYIKKQQYHLRYPQKGQITHSNIEIQGHYTLISPASPPQLGKVSSELQKALSKEQEISSQGADTVPGLAAEQPSMDTPLELVIYNNNVQFYALQEKNRSLSSKCTFQHKIWLIRQEESYSQIQSVYINKLQFLFRALPENGQVLLRKVTSEQLLQNSRGSEQTWSLSQQLQELEESLNVSS